MEIIVQQGQTLADTTIEHAGDIEAWFKVAMDNGKGITEDIQTGEILNINIIKRKSVQLFFKNRTKKPATEWTVTATEQGIDIDAIESNLIIY